MGQGLGSAALPYRDALASVLACFAPSRIGSQITLTRLSVNTVATIVNGRDY